jgi:hypothetical protein
VTDDHDAIDELLAGYVLEALSGADADEADRLLVDHVPGCARCHETLDDFAAVVGDLGLSVPAAPAPDLLWPRIERDLEPRSGRRFALGSGGRVAAAVAAVVAVVGIAGLALTTSGGDAPALANADIASIRSLASRPDAETARSTRSPRLASRRPT